MKCPQCGYEYMNPAFAAHSCWEVKRKNHLAGKSGMLKKPKTGQQVTKSILEKIMPGRKT